MASYHSNYRNEWLVRYKLHNAGTVPTGSEISKYFMAYMLGIVYHLSIYEYDGTRHCCGYLLNTFSNDPKFAIYKRRYGTITTMPYNEDGSGTNCACLYSRYLDYIEAARFTHGTRLKITCDIILIEKAFYAYS